MIKTESDVYTKLKNHFPKCLLQRIESGSTSLGIPDIFFRTKEYEGWMELKILYRFPIYSKISIPFQPGQFVWLQKYTRLKGNAILLIYMPATKDCYIFKGENIQQKYEGKNDFLKKTSFCGEIRYIRIDDLKPL